jgi:23S rRNA-/tRNA-specific pseudouridylate synthase
MSAEETKPSPRLQPGYSPEIIWETDSWMVVNKPALMAAHPSKPGDLCTLWHWLQDLL